MSQPYPVIPIFFEFRSLSRPLQVLYLASLFVGLTIAKVVSSTSTGRLFIIVAAVPTGASVPVLHACLYYNKGNPDDLPTNASLVNITTHVGGGLTLLYTFSGFWLTGLGAGIIFVIPHTAALVGATVLVAASLWLVPYSVWLMWK